MHIKSLHSNLIYTTNISLSKQLYHQSLWISTSKTIQVLSHYALS